MKRRIIALGLLLTLLFSLCSCSIGQDNSYFRVEFIDVGQGDSALIECDRHFMLIDGGDKAAGDKVYNILKEKEIQHLDILAISHLHADHIGGLIKALTYVSDADLVLSNSKDSETKTFKDLEHQINVNNLEITIPSVGDEYHLGSADVEVIDVCSEESNDSLVLLVTYGKTTFLFTGDIEEPGQRRIIQKYRGKQTDLTDTPFKIDVMKIPHHGADATSLADFMEIFMPDYVVISVGAGNQYGHPDKETMNLLNSKTWKPYVYRTDESGNICIRSDGKKIEVTTEK